MVDVIPLEKLIYGLMAAQMIEGVLILVLVAWCAVLRHEKAKDSEAFLGFKRYIRDRIAQADQFNSRMVDLQWREMREALAHFEDRLHARNNKQMQFFSALWVKIPDLKLPASFWDTPPRRGSVSMPAPDGSTGVGDAPG